jgi:hypothetical protein
MGAVYNKIEKSNITWDPVPGQGSKVTWSYEDRNDGNDRILSTVFHYTSSMILSIIVVAVCTPIVFVYMYGVLFNNMYILIIRSVFGFRLRILRIKHTFSQSLPSVIVPYTHSGHVTPGMWLSCERNDMLAFTLTTPQKRSQIDCFVSEVLPSVLVWEPSLADKLQPLPLCD